MATETQHQRRTKNLGTVILVSCFVLGIFGCVVFGGGLFLVIDKVSFVTPVIGTSLIHDATVLMTAGGCISLVVSFFGCCGVVIRHRMLLAIFISLLISILVLEWVGAVMAIVFKTWLSDQIRMYMRDSLQVHYGMNTTKDQLQLTKAWDIAQQKWYCCAVEENSWSIYRQSEWYTLQPGVPEADKPLVPKSCCRRDQYGVLIDVFKCQTFLYGPPSVQSNVQNEALFYKGCYDAALKNLSKVAEIVIGIGITLYFIALGLIVATVWLCKLLY